MDPDVRRYAATFLLNLSYNPETDVYRVGRGHEPESIPLHGAREATVYIAGFANGEHTEHSRCVEAIGEVPHARTAVRGEGPRFSPPGALKGETGS